jgi:hypothetical protein
VVDGSGLLLGGSGVVAEVGLTDVVAFEAALAVLV